VSYATISDLRSQLGGTSPADHPEYRARMLHDLPPTKTADRVPFIVKHATGKRVLEFGASGQLTGRLREVASQYLGVDREAAGTDVLAFDLDDVSLSDLPTFDAQIIICGEVLEHLSNPGWFLTRLRKQYAGVPLLVTVPNAFSRTAVQWLAKGKENVNLDHVAWYSPKTIATLLQRAGYAHGDLYYYGGTDPLSEGLIVLSE
jgi:hypothetical protein